MLVVAFFFFFFLKIYMILKKSTYKGVKWGCLKELGAEKQAHVSPGSPEPGRARHVRASLEKPSPLPSPVWHQVAHCLSTSHRAVSDFRCLGCAPSPRLLLSFSAAGPGATGGSCAGLCGKSGRQKRAVPLGARGEVTDGEAGAREAAARRWRFTCRAALAGHRVP